MRSEWLGYRVKGFAGVRRYADRIDTISETAAQRLRALNFWAQHGLAAAMDAFGVSRCTFYGWKKAYRQAQGNTAALNNQSRAPVNRRKRQDWDRTVLEHML